jgi:hypothetical protein
MAKPPPSPSRRKRAQRRGEIEQVHLRETVEALGGKKERIGI